MFESSDKSRIIAEFETRFQHSEIGFIEFVRDNVDGKDEATILELIASATQLSALKGRLPNSKDFVELLPNMEPSDIHEVIQKATTTFVNVHCPISELAGRIPVEFGDFRFIKELGRDYSGVVYEAIQLSTSRRTAIKVFFAFSRDLEDKLQILSLVDHSGVPKTYEHGTMGSHNFIAREFIDGPVLRSFCRRPPGLSPRQAVSAIAKVLGTIGECHSRGLIHWSLSPDKIMLRDGEPIVVDFGLDQHHEVMHLVNAQTAYRAPELLNNPSNISPVHCDLFSIGVVLYEVLTGAPPKKATGQSSSIRRTSDFRYGIDDSLDAICMRAISDSPASRFPSALSFKEALETWMNRDASEIEAIPSSESTPSAIQNETKKRRLSSSQILIYTLGLALLISWIIIAKLLW